FALPSSFSIARAGQGCPLLVEQRGVAPARYRRHRSVRDLLVSPTGEPNSSVTEARYRPGRGGTPPRCVCRRFVDGDDRRWLTEKPEPLASPCRGPVSPRQPLGATDGALDAGRGETRTF